MLFSNYVCESNKYQATALDSFLWKQSISLESDKPGINLWKATKHKYLPNFCRSKGSEAWAQNHARLNRNRFCLPLETYIMKGSIENEGSFPNWYCRGWNCFWKASQNDLWSLLTQRRFCSSSSSKSLFTNWKETETNNLFLWMNTHERKTCSVLRFARRKSLLTTARTNVKGNVIQFSHDLFQIITMFYTNIVQVSFTFSRWHSGKFGFIFLWRVYETTKKRRPTGYSLCFYVVLFENQRSGTETDPKIFKLIEVQTNTAQRKTRVDHPDQILESSHNQPAFFLFVPEYFFSCVFPFKSNLPSRKDNVSPNKQPKYWQGCCWAKLVHQLKSLSVVDKTGNMLQDRQADRQAGPSGNNQCFPITPQLVSKIVTPLGGFHVVANHILEDPQAWWPTENELAGSLPFFPSPYMLRVGPISRSLIWCNWSLWIMTMRWRGPRNSRPSLCLSSHEAPIQNSQRSIKLHWNLSNHSVGPCALWRQKRA